MSGVKPLVYLFAAIATFVWTHAASAQQVPTRSNGPSATAPATTPMAQPATQQSAPSETLELPINRAEAVDLQTTATNIVVGNEQVADVNIDPNHPQKAFVVARAVGSTNIFFIDAEGQIFKNLNVRVTFDSDGLQAALSTLMPKENIRVSMYRDNVFLSGTVRSADAATNAESIARRFVAGDTNVTNMLSIAGSQQVILKVRVSEMARSLRKKLAANTTLGKNIGRFRVDLSTTNPLTTLTSFGSGTLNTGTVFLGSPSIEALERHALVKTLAEPTLTALSGETASFLSGGEYPFPTGVDENGNAILEFREFGVRLNFTPVVQDAGRISLNVSAEISAIDTGTTVVVANSTINALTKKRTQTTIDLPSGGTLMISRLLDHDMTNTLAGLPYLKDIPILGALFRSTEFQRDETELIVTVTAYLAKPADAHDKLALPSDGFEPASDLDIYLLGRLHRHYGKGNRSFWDDPIMGPIGYILK